MRDRRSDRETIERGNFDLKLESLRELLFLSSATKIENPVFVYPE